MGDTATKKEIEDARRRMGNQLDKMILNAFMGAATSTVAKEPEPLDVNKMLKELDDMAREARRNQITFVVRVPHVGPIAMHKTPCDGEVVELSWPEANALHQEWPLRLSKVLSQWEAEFIPAGLFPGQFIGRNLPVPPWDVPEDREPLNDEDILKIERGEGGNDTEREHPVKGADTV